MATLTFLFADVVGSDAHWAAEAPAMAEAVHLYETVIEESLARHGGSAVRPRGESDGRFLVFPSASAATTVALAVGSRLLATDWPTSGPLAVRMGLVSGTAAWRHGDYYGSDVNRAARLRAAAHGRQVLLSRATAEATGDSLPPGASLRDLGLHRLKDLSAPERIFQLVHPELPFDFPPLRTLDVRRHNLPVAVTDFVDRPADMAQVTDMLAHSRVVTLVGPAGCGKTRLALQAAAQAVERYGDGVWLIEPRLTEDLRAIVAIAGLRRIEDLAGHNVLIVLDGCDHAPTAAAEVARQLLQMGPQVQVLTTSRALTPIDGAATWTVPGLATPPVDAPPLPEAANRYSAVQLFVQRAEAARSGFDLSESNVAAVAEICRLTAGNARALEEAAVRLRASTPAELVARLRRSSALGAV